MIILIFFFILILSIFLMRLGTKYWSWFQPWILLCMPSWMHAAFLGHNLVHIVGAAIFKNIWLKRFVL